MVGEAFWGSALQASGGGGDAYSAFMWCGLVPNVSTLTSRCRNRKRDCRNPEIISSHPAATGKTRPQDSASDWFLLSVVISVLKSVVSFCVVDDIK